MREIFLEVFERDGLDRPGWVRRPGYVRDFIADDFDILRGNSSAYYHVVYEQDGRVDGYVTHRTMGDTLKVSELIATSDDACQGQQQMGNGCVWWTWELPWRAGVIRRAGV